MTSSSPVVLVVAHLTDTHFGNDQGLAAYRTRLVLDELLRMDPRPDVLVHSGDVTDHGHADEYAEAVHVLSTWEGPLVICPGNHDVRTPYAAAFLDGADGPANRAHAVAGARFLMLDSLVDEVDGERQDHGVLRPETLEWLDAELAGDLSPTFVCLHHPPVEIGVSLMDPIMLTDARAARRGARSPRPRRRHPRRPRPHDGGLDVRGPARARRRRGRLHGPARPGGPPCASGTTPPQLTRSTCCTPTAG